MHTTRHLRNRRLAAAGFSLVEIVIVMVIMAILAGTAIKMMSSSGDDARLLRVNSDIEAISTGMLRYEALAGRPPSTEQGIKALMEKPTTDPIPDRWASIFVEEPKDPWGNPYHYAYPAVKSKRAFDIWSVGKDGKDGTEDDIGNYKSTAAAK